jgi:hypothetical protein
MRTRMPWLLVLCLASSALAIDMSNRHIPPVKDGAGDGMSDTREGGESYDDAIVIAALPFTDSGATCDNRNDITPSCGSYSVAPDVVYVFTPAGDACVGIDLCDSGYDTILEIQDGIGNPVACNDDYCGLQSEIDRIHMYAGHTYYIIVDGYGSDCGSYVLTMSSFTPCCYWPCPAGMMSEGEPECHDDYVDIYNGGCFSEPPVFQPIWGDAEGTASLCGKSGTYLSAGGWSYRDTDWFEVVGTGGPLTASLGAEFSPMLLFIYGTDCEDPQVTSAYGECFDELVLERVVESGVAAWIFVAPAAFSGVPCDRRYILELTGIASGSTAGGESAWGEIKRLFR